MGATGPKEAAPEASGAPDRDGWLRWAEGVEERLLALDRQQREVLREWKEILIEWESFFEKFRNLYARLNRRDVRDSQRNEAKEDSRPINPAAARLLGLGQSSKGGDA